MVLCHCVTVNMLGKRCRLAPLPSHFPLVFGFPNAKLLFLLFYLCGTCWPHDARAVDGNNCPSSEWNIMCQPCCEYHLIQCRCPSQGSRVGYTVPCCRNALDQCDPCIIHPGCSLFENCKGCHNGTWKANDDFFVRGRFCTVCRHGWSGGDCRTCGGVIKRAQGHVALESYPTNARCEWMLHAEPGHSIELRFSMLSLEPDHSCRYDYIELRDGDSLSSPVIGRFCGDQLPRPIRSSGNMLHVLFVSDGYNNFDGFVFTYHESSVSTTRRRVCPFPEKPANGNIQPVYGPVKELLSVTYLCNPPYKLLGPQQRSCLSNSTWSATEPICFKVISTSQSHTGQCAPLPKVLNGYYKPVPRMKAGTSRTYMIEFFCKSSYILSGNHFSTCLSNGVWTSRPPQCVKACREPKVSDLVKQKVVYKTYDLMKPSLNTLTLARQPETEDSILEGMPKGFHPLYTHIEYTCASMLYRHEGSSQRTCLKTGRWSGRHVSCSPVCGKVTTVSQNLTDTHWPWHAAVYIRTSYGHRVATTQADQPISVSDQQGSSEESTFWYLACSGALISQRSVLVAAHCVFERGKQHAAPPAHVKVVLGLRFHVTSHLRKSQQHHRVSTILVHPGFDSEKDSDVAVLKLVDKARISYQVLPVCLPSAPQGAMPHALATRWTMAEPSDPHTHSGQTDLVEIADTAQCKTQTAHTEEHTREVTGSVLCVIRKHLTPNKPCHLAPGTTTIQAGTSSSSLLLSQREKPETFETVWELIGLERSNSGESNCHQQTYAVVTRIADFQEWIENNMK